MIPGPTEVLNPSNEFDPAVDQTLRVWHLQQILAQYDPLREVQVYANIGGSPLILDIMKIQDCKGHLQIVAE